MHVLGGTANTLLAIIVFAKVPAGAEMAFTIFRQRCNLMPSSRVLSLQDHYLAYQKYYAVLTRTRKRPTFFANGAY